MSKPKRKEDAEAIALVRPLTKSRFKSAHECPTKLFYTGKAQYPNKKNDDQFLKALARGGFQVGKLAQIELGPGPEVTSRKYDESLAETAKLLGNDNVTIFEGAFRYGNHFIRVDALKNQGNEVELIEVKSASWPLSKGDV